MTDCQAFRDAASARLDGELSERETAALDGHLRECRICADHAVSLALARAAVRRLPGLQEPPTALHARIETFALAAAEARTRRQLPVVAGTALTAAAALAVGVASLLGARAESDFARALIRDHANFAAAVEPVEIRSASAPEIERWFGPRVGFPVRAVALPGARLTGARLCQIGPDRAALLYYESGGRRVSLFILPRPDSVVRASAGMSRFAAAGKGFQLACRERSGLRYAVVADLPPERIDAMLVAGLSRL